MKTKLFVGMSHKLMSDQIFEFDEVYESRVWGNMALDKIDPKIDSSEIEEYASMLVIEALNNKCTHFCIVGEPALVFYSWKMAKEAGFVVVQSTTECISVETRNNSGKVFKSSVFKHVQWRVID